MQAVLDPSRDIDAIYRALSGIPDDAVGEAGCEDIATNVASNLAERATEDLQAEIDRRMSE